MMTNQRENAGRYTRVNDAQAPGPELPRKRPNMRIVVAAVPDPMPLHDANGALLPPRRQRVAVNANTDALENEHSRGRISTAAYTAGCLYQMILERSRGHTSPGASFEPKNRTDAFMAHELAILSGIQRAQDAVDLITETRKAIGLLAETLLSDVLGARITLTMAAVARGYTSTDGRRRVAGEFREALEGLALHWERQRAPRKGG